MERIDGLALKRMMLNAANTIENNKQVLNELNVFPVPDGDTGTNMSLTINAAATELLPKEIPEAGLVAEAVAKAMLRGARGNSGVILSLLFRGFSKRLSGLRDFDGKIFAEAIQAGVESAYKSVMKPAEGTILTVSRVSAAKGLAFSEEAGGADAIESVLAHMVESSLEALSETTNQNPVLQKAGVVDAGAKGFCFILEAMLKTVRGETVESVSAPAAQSRAAADFSAFNTKDIKFMYCTEFIVNLENKKSSNLFRALLDSIGDSLVFVEDEEIIKIHVHTNDPGRALQEGVKYGSLSAIKIENMRDQHTEKVIITGMEPVRPNERVIAAPEKRYGMVAVCAGEGLRSVFQDIGCDQVVEGGQTMNPSTEDILRAIDQTPAEIVLVFPNNKNIIMAAEQCIAMTDKTVLVIPTKSVPQGVSALLVFDPDADPGKNREMMMQAIVNVRTGQLTYAARDSLFDGRRIKAGDHLAILDGELIGHHKLEAGAVRKLAHEMAKKSAEFVTIYFGLDVTDEQAQDVRIQFEKEFKTAEITMLYGGQPVYSYLISAE